MKLCFLIDIHSPIARNWVSRFIQGGHDVHIISSYPCTADTLPGASIHWVPIAFSRFSRAGRATLPGPKIIKILITSVMANFRSVAFTNLSSIKHHWLAPLELHRHIKTVRNLIELVSPDLIHAMRIPFEGIVASIATPYQYPLLISVWGNDFTLHASPYPLVGWQTRQAMQRADALHCDCRRDLYLAQSWGFRPDKPATVLPSGGGIQAWLFYPGPHSLKLRQQLEIPAEATVVINPRGYRSYIRNDTFFQAIPFVLQARPKTIFICTEMQSNPDAKKWTKQMSISHNVRLLPLIPREQMAELFRLAQVTVSPSIHDGTPNTLLEAMACGCFPVAGDIESVREWIEDGINGLLCDPASPEAIAKAILKALYDKKLRENAQGYNIKLIAERAEYEMVMKKAEEFYHQVLEHHQERRAMTKNTNEC